MRTRTLQRHTDERTVLRLTFVAALIASCLLVLLARLWFVQIAAGARYASLAERGRVRTVPLEAPRGRILDRRGRVIVDNRQVHVIGVKVAEMGERRETVVADLAQLLGVPIAELERRIDQAGSDPVRSAPVAFDVPERIALYVWERQSTRFPGVYAELVPRRAYPEGQLAAHVVGYTGEVSAEQLAQPSYAGYEPGTQVGMAGVERTYEAVLHGRPGARRMQVDAAGDVVRQLSERPPVPGADLQLTIDRDIQRLAEQALRRGIRRARRLPDDDGRNDGTFAAVGGAVVVMDPRDGAVRAMASAPGFWPEDFVGGIDPATYARLTDTRRHAPLVNRAVQATFPPGSVFKVVSTAAALRGEFATPLTRLPCPGVWRWGGAGQAFRNWTSADLGSMTLRGALTQSCDTVFYELARRMWEHEERSDAAGELIGREAVRFGYGAASGIDLPDERDGVVPGRMWKRRYWAEHHDAACRQAQRTSDAAARALLTELCRPLGARWRGGDAVNLSIGQGDLLATPLQVADSIAAIANGGSVWRPHVADVIRHADGRVEQPAPRRLGTVDLSPTALRVIRRGLEGVTAPGGTAAAAFAGARMPVAGKTGTAEVADAQPFAWFAGYGPTESPRYVVAVLVEQGGGGSTTAAPIARWITDGLAGLEERAAP